LNTIRNKVEDKILNEIETEVDNKRIIKNQGFCFNA